MGRGIVGVFIIRIHHNMAVSISTQNVAITAYNFEKGCVTLTPENIDDGLKSLPRLVENRTILDELRDMFHLVKSIKTANPDIVHVNALQDLISTYIAVRICSVYGVKPAVVAMSRNSLSWKNPQKAWLYAKIIQYFSDGFIALSTTHKNQLIQLGVTSQKIAFIPNPFDRSYITSGNHHAEDFDKPISRIIYVANICENKSQDILIKAASTVIKKHPEIHFELVGKVIPGEEGYFMRLKHLLQQLDLEQNIHFTGEVPYEQVVTLLTDSDVFVFPTRAEMMPRSVIEAMVLGKPVVASAVDGILDLIQHRKTGILVEPGNVQDLADSMIELIENPGLAHTLGSAGKEFVLDFCSPENVGTQICGFYTHIKSLSRLN